MQAKLSARREHSVGLICALRNQIVDQNGRVCFRPVKDERRLALHFQRAINARHDPLAGGLFVTGRSIDLSGEEET